MYDPPRTEREALRERVERGLRVLARGISNDPAHARVLHRLSELASAAHLGDAPNPYHARRMRRLLERCALHGCPGADPERIPRCEKATALSDPLRESCARTVLDAAVAPDYRRMGEQLMLACDHLRLSNHLQMHRDRRAARHLGAMSDADRATVPTAPRRFLEKHA